MNPNTFGAFRNSRKTVIPAAGVVGKDMFTARNNVPRHDCYICQNLKKMRYTLIFALLLAARFAFAEEGMLIPSLLQAFESDMKAHGMRISADQLYSVNHSSVKDAVLQFGGGCTAEIVSAQGLLLTNHHCGYSQVQQHSSLEHDYLKNGYWAKDHSEELTNPGLTATRIVRIDDVTAAILSSIAGMTDEAKIQAILQQNFRTLIADATRGTHYTADVKAFDYGNSYFLMLKETFLDIRFVGTPPNSIGKFGGDTDNWIWPRHTGDFSVFRIYAGPDNKPAPYAADNVPYQPLHFLPISFKARKKGEFTMVYGFPGVTEQHLSSENLRYIMDVQRPMEIEMRTHSLAVIDAAMRSSDQARIQYAAKQARIANAWKKNIGQIGGLRELNAVAVKQESEAEYNRRAASRPEWAKYGGIVDQMNKLTAEKSIYEYNYTLFIEYLFVGPEFFKLARVVEDVQRNESKYAARNELDAKIAAIKKQDGFFRDYDARVDRLIYDTLTKDFRRYLVDDLEKKITALNDAKLEEKIYKKSIFTDKKRYEAFMSKVKTVKDLEKLAKDPAYMLFTQCFTVFQQDVLPGASEFSGQMDALLKTYIEGKYAMFPDDKHWADANSTLRITYGNLEGSAPVDGMAYTEHTTLKGMIDKYRTGNPDFELLPRMLELYEAKDYGNYGQDGELWVCFTGSNHTTGGNSGSPVLDADGHLMGLNFDRSWESTMSDYLFDPDRCRNIVVDIRYVLWVMDKYSGAKHLVDEMQLVKN